MDSALEDQYLQKLEEFVYDEDKIVTFKWLCKALDIHVNDSKKLLDKYVEDQKIRKTNGLGVVYLVSGLLDDDTRNISLINKEDFEEKSTKFKQIFYKFVHTVHKSKNVDLNGILLVDRYDVNNPEANAIKGFVRNSHCVKRKFKEKAPLPELKKVDICKKKPSLFANVPPKKIKSEDDTSKHTVSDNNQNEKEYKEEKRFNEAHSRNNKVNGGIASFLSKMPPKSQQEKPSTSKTTQNTPGSETELFDEDVFENDKANKASSSKFASLIDTDDSEDEKNDSDISRSKKTEKATKKTNKRKRDKSRQKAQKRRKRIIERNDSDSDDIFENADKDEETEVVNDSEEEDVVFKPKSEPAPLNKRRKLVTQTYTDEDGYLLTRKEWVYESGPEEEEAVAEIKKEEEKQEKQDDKKVVNDKKEDNTSAVNDKKLLLKDFGHHKKGGKSKKIAANSQPTLMSFFKKP